MFNVLSSATEASPAHIRGYVLVVSYVKRRGATGVVCYVQRNGSTVHIEVAKTKSVQTDPRFISAFPTLVVLEASTITNGTYAVF